MPRRAAAQKRPIPADPVHHNRLVQQVINKVMRKELLRIVFQSITSNVMLILYILSHNLLLQ